MQPVLLNYTLCLSGIFVSFHLSTSTSCYVVFVFTKKRKQKKVTIIINLLDTKKVNNLSSGLLFSFLCHSPLN